MGTRMLLQTQDLSLTYGGTASQKKSTAAVASVNLDLRSGEVLGIVGESGCGKSSLAKLLLGLLAPSSGKILLNGRNYDELARGERARRMQPVFQDPYSSLNPRKTISQIVGLPLDVHAGLTKRERDIQVAEILTLVGLSSGYLQRLPSELSGGQRQRISIARALILKPQIVICDEPTSALDVSVQAQILNLLISLRKEFGLAYIFISHNLAIVEHIADRVAVMRSGHIVESGSVSDIFDRPSHPYTQSLLHAALSPKLGRPEPSA